MNRDELTAIVSAEQRHQRSCRFRVKVCEGAGCISRGATALKHVFQAIASGKPGIEVTGAGCMGLCSEGPLIRVEPQGTLYPARSPREVNTIVQSHLEAGEPARALA